MHSLHAAGLARSDAGLDRALHRPRAPLLRRVWLRGHRQRGRDAMGISRCPRHAPAQARRAQRRRVADLRQLLRAPASVAETRIASPGGPSAGREPRRRRVDQGRRSQPVAGVMSAHGASHHRQVSREHRLDDTPRRASGVAVAVITGAALAILQVLQQAIGASTPRPVIYGLMMAAVFLAGLARERQRVRRRQNDTAARLHRLLVIWPPRPLRDLDRMWLGTFPARRDLDSGAPYVTRGRRRAARGAGARRGRPPVRAARAGKSRTAVEAAGSALSEAQVIAPRGPDRCPSCSPSTRRSTLAAASGSSGWTTSSATRRSSTPARSTSFRRSVRRAGPRRSCDRFPARSAPAGDRHRQIRADESGRAATASGVRGEPARAFPPRPDFDCRPRDPGQAEPRPPAVPGHQFRRRRRRGGAGQQWPGSGPGGGPDAPSEIPSQAPIIATPSSSFRPRERWTRSSASAWSGGVVVIDAGAPSIADNHRSSRRLARRSSRASPVAGAIDLHGSGEASYLFLFQDTASARRPRSEEIRIYDRRGDRLVQRLRFEPDRPGAVFQFRSATDIDFDGASEIVGGYGLPGEGRGALVPFAIDWDNAERRYDLVSLDLGAPVLAACASAPLPHPDANTEPSTRSRSCSVAPARASGSRASRAGLHRHPRAPAPRRRLLPRPLSPDSTWPGWSCTARS